MKEEWKPVVGWESTHKVSNLGRVKSIHRTIICSDGRKIEYPEYELKQHEWCGYMKVHLNCGKKRKWEYVHRIVGQAFLDNPDNLPCINHKDYNRSNNIADNLEFCTYKYNNDYSNSTQKMLEASRKVKSWEKAVPKSVEITSKPVLQFTLDGRFVAEYPSTQEAARQTGAKHICCVCNGKRKSAAGYIWRYK